jgi:hypothetical protein
MLSRKFIRKYENVKKEAVWQGWIDVVNWPRWDGELEYCDYSGKFTAGNSFILKPKGGPKVHITLSFVEPHTRFVDYCKFFGATMFDDHQVYDEGNGVRIEHTISVKGPLAFLWWHLVAKNVAKGASEQTDNFINYVRSHHV